MGILISLCRGSALVTWTVLRVIVRRIRNGPQRPNWSIWFELVVNVIRKLMSHRPKNYDYITSKDDVDNLQEAMDSMHVRIAYVRKQARGPIAFFTKWARAGEFEDVSIAGVDCRWFYPSKEFARPSISIEEQVAVNLLSPESKVRQDQVVLYLHGGGYVLCSLNSHHGFMNNVAKLCDCRVLGVEYSLAPNARFPEALQECFAVYKQLKSTGAKVVVMGDSAGGGLAIALALLISRENAAPLHGVVGMSPWTDLTCSSDTWSSCDDYLIHEKYNLSPMLYAGSTPLTNELISPVFGDFKDFPPLFLQVGTAEVLLDDSRKLAVRAKSTGAERIVLQTYPHMPHCFQFLPFSPCKDAALEDMRKFVAECFSEEC